MLKTFSGDSSQTGLAGLEKRLTGRDPDDSVIPRTVRRAVRFMLAGGAVTFIVGLFLIIVFIVDKNALTDTNGKKISNGEFTSSMISTAVTYLILVAIWVLVARMNRAGYGWARILASIFAAISTFEAYQLVNSLAKDEFLSVPYIVYITGTLIIWALGVLSIAFLWRAESTAYIRARSSAR
jgi:hypothetical protein